MTRKLFYLLCFVSVTHAHGQFWDITDPMPLKGSVNSVEAEESMPVFSQDGKQIFFVRTYDVHSTGGEEDQDIWSATFLEDKGFSNTISVKDLNNQYNNALVCLKDGDRTAYLLDAYEGKKDMLKGLSTSQRNGNHWSTPIKIEIPNLDINGDYYSFYVSDDQQIILISYAGPQSLGEEDLYVSVRQNGTWSSPIHMGNALNSSGFEISPFLTSGNDTLYFASNGHNGVGGSDIFYAVRNGTSWTDWSTPVNLGPKINSPSFEAYFVKRNNQIFWSSNVNREKSDILTATILSPPPIHLSCTGKDVTIYNGSDGILEADIEGGVPPLIFKWSNSVTTEDQTMVKKGEYALEVTDSIGQMATCMVSISQPGPPVSFDEPYHLPEIRYPFNQWTFVNDATIHSTDSLMYVFHLLEDHPNFVLELSSHTDCRGKPEINQKLSENRARACYKFLVEEKGIDPRRIVPVGKGESKPRTVYKKGNVYLGEKPKNMTGVQKIVLTEAYINQYKQTNKVLYERLHQLNRRTEVLVLSKSFDATTHPPADPKYKTYVAYP
jgi:outer membrane protein OmpA-like peptidoglycan-associated protein